MEVFHKCPVLMFLIENSFFKFSFVIIFMIIAVIPAHNEEKTIGKVIETTKKYVNKIIVVDDCSTDNTAKIARNCGAMIIQHKRNLGLGCSLRSGFKKALRISKENDIIITLDADGQHDSNDIPKFIKAMKNGYDFVLGKRDLRKYPFRKRIGNLFLNVVTNFISGTNLKDTESGFRAFKRNALKKLHLRAKGYEIAVEIIFEIGRNYIRSTNVPVRTPTYVKGTSIYDGIRNFRYLLHRRERTWHSYIEDMKYVLKKFF